MPSNVTAEQAAAARRELGLGVADPLVVHVGNIRPGKGHDNLIATARYLPDNVTVVSIGTEKFDGDLARLRHSIETANLTGRVRLLGRRTDALAFISAADVYVNPSEHEGLPVTILEALALAKPVVATAVGGVPSVVRSGETGILVEPMQPARLAEAIVTLLEDRANAAMLGKNGRDVVESEFGLDRMIESFESLYEEVLHG